MRLLSMKDILTESKKKNGQPTIKARETRKLILTVDLSTEATKLKFKILDPNGEPLRITDQNQIVRTIKTDDIQSSTFYSASNKVLVKNDYKTVQMIYEPEHKLKTGTYTVAIENNGLSIGSLQVRLK
jgi:hypothetical protein